MHTDTPTTDLIPRFPPRWADVFGEDDSGIFAECELRGVRFVWRWIPPGKFTMGSPAHQRGRWDDEGPQHEVILTKGFWLGETPVTQTQWEAVTRQNPSHFKGTERPVEQVSWLDCRAFIQQINDLLPGLHAALPTEAQWEFACRARTKSAFHDGSPCSLPEGLDPALDALGWFDKNSGGETHPVRQKAANAWGLYDMHGNVWEWCRDAWNQRVYTTRGKLTVDPEEQGDDGAHRVARGGSWFNQAQNCRAAFRVGVVLGSRWHDRGLRLSAGQEPAVEPPGAERPGPQQGRGTRPSASRGAAAAVLADRQNFWDAVQDLLRQAAEKTLTATDVSAGATHGREINSVPAVRTLMGGVETTGPLVWVHFGGDADKVVTTGTYKWHEARANQPGRSPEWRLYYGSTLPPQASAGDMLVLLRSGRFVCGLLFHPAVQMLQVCRLFRQDVPLTGEDAEIRDALLDHIASALAEIGWDSTEDGNTPARN